MPALSATAVNLAPFTIALAIAIAKLAGMPCQVTSVEVAPAPHEAGMATAHWFGEPGGGCLGVQLSSTLAEALVSHRYGGGLNGHEGQLGSTASVLRLHAELMVTLLDVAAASWLTNGRKWLAAAVVERERFVLRPPLQDMTIDLDGFSCPLGVGIAAAVVPLTTTIEPTWTHDLRRALEHVSFPVRAVLFETRLPLAKAARLRPGDVLPIETPREVGLRVGAHRLASGTISPTDEGGHLVTIRASARSFRQPSHEKAPL